MALLRVVSFRFGHETADLSHHDINGGRSDCKNKDITKNAEKSTNTEESTPCVAMTPLKSILRTPRYSSYTATSHSETKSTQAFSSTLLAANDNSSGSSRHHNLALYHTTKKRKAITRPPFQRPGTSISMIHKIMALRYTSTPHRDHDKGIPSPDQLLYDLNCSIKKFSQSTIVTHERSVLSPFLVHSDGNQTSPKNAGSENAFATSPERMPERSPASLSCNKSEKVTSQDPATKALNIVPTQLFAKKGAVHHFATAHNFDIKQSMKTDHGANAKHPLLVTDDQAPVSMQHVPGVSGQSAPKSRYTTLVPNGDAPEAARTINFRSHDDHGTVNNFSLLRSQRPTIKERLSGSENSKTQPSFQFDASLVLGLAPNKKPLVSLAVWVCQCGCLFVTSVHHHADVHALTRMLTLRRLSTPTHRQTHTQLYCSQSHLFEALATGKWPAKPVPQQNIFH